MRAGTRDSRSARIVNRGAPMERVWRATAAAVWVVSCCAAAAACGGSTSSEITGPPGSGSGQGQGGDAGTTSAAYTLDDVCEKVVPKICEIRKPCCEKSGAYDEAGCIAHAKLECEADVADARGGRAAFHPERIDACLAKLPALYDTCTVTADLLYRVVKELPDCAAFEGQLAEGASCERDSQCARSDQPGELTDCDDTTKRCKRFRLLGEGAPCVLEEGANLCDQGLFCDASLAVKPPAGTCKKATPLDSPCDANNPLNLECGFGRYCAGATGLCALGKGAGAPCEGDLECAAGKCEGAPGQQKCATPDSIVKPEECTGR